MDEPTRGDCIQLYGIMVERAKHQGNLFWTSFSAFLVIVSGLFAVLMLGFDGKTPGEPYGRILLYGGMLTSWAWFLSMCNGVFWQEFFNHVARNLEKRYPEQLLKAGMYGLQYPTKWPKMPDMVGVALVFGLVASVAWGYLIYLEWNWQGLSIAAGVLPAYWFLSCWATRMTERMSERRYAADLAGGRTKKQTPLGDANTG